MRAVTLARAGIAFSSLLGWQEATKQARNDVALRLPRKLIDKLDVALVTAREARPELSVALGAEQPSHSLKQR